MTEAQDRIDLPDLTPLVRLLERTLGRGFNLAVVEAPSPLIQNSILKSLEPHFQRLDAEVREVNVFELSRYGSPERSISFNLWALLSEAVPKDSLTEKTLLVLTGFEDLMYKGDVERSALLQQVNVQRDLFVRDYSCWWLMFIHPQSRQQWYSVAPDFSDFAACWIEHSEDARGTLNLSFVSSSMEARSLFSRAGDDWPDALKDADRLAQLSRYDEALDTIYTYRATVANQGIAARGLALADLIEAEIIKIRGEPEKALQKLTQDLLPMFRASESVEDKLVFAMILNDIGSIHWARGEYDDAFKYCRQSLDIREEIGDKRGQGESLNDIGLIYYARGDYDFAMKYILLSLDINKQIGDKQGEGAALNNMSMIYKARGDYDSALECLLLGLDIARQSNNKQGEGAALNNISLMYKALGDYSLALKYLLLSLDMRKQIGDKQGEGATLNNIGMIYKLRGDYDSAMKYAFLGLDIVRQIGDKQGEGATLNNISQIYDARGDYDSALNYLLLSLDIQKQIGDVAGLCVTLFNIGHLLLEKEEVGEALNAWLNVYVLARRMNLAQVLDALENLAPQIGLEGGLLGWEELAREHGMLSE